MRCSPLTGSQRRTEREVHLTTRKRQTWTTKDGRAQLASIWKLEASPGKAPQSEALPSPRVGTSAVQKGKMTQFCCCGSTKTETQDGSPNRGNRAVAQREYMPTGSRGRRRMGSFGAGRESTIWGRGVRGAGKEEREAGPGDSSERLRRRPPGREQETQGTGLQGRMGAHGFSWSSLKG